MSTRAKVPAMRATARWALLGPGSSHTNGEALDGALTLLGSRRILVALVGCVVGSILYRIAIQLALSSDALGLQASDLNLVTAVLVTFALILPRLRGGAQS